MRKTNKRRKKLTRTAALLLIAAGLATSIFFITRIVLTEMEYRKGDAAYDALAELVQGEPDESPVLSDPAAESESESETDGSEIPEVDLDVAREVNSDIAAWLYCPDTVIDYPVCHGDDNAYYLTHLADGTYNSNGCLFIDCSNAGDFTDDNTIIYGHHMDSGKMFASLIKYADQSYYDAHPIMCLTIGDEQYELEIFSGYVTTVDSGAYVISCGTEHAFAKWLREIVGKSDFTPHAMTLGMKDRIVTLSTCAYDFQNARYVVHGRLVKM